MPANGAPQPRGGYGRPAAGGTANVTHALSGSAGSRQAGDRSNRGEAVPAR